MSDDVIETVVLDAVTVDGAVVTDVVTVSEDSTVLATETTTTFTVTAAMGLPGPPGPPGPAGGEAGQPRWQGIGPPPDIIVGAHPGDGYLDTSTGDYYQLF